MPQNGRKTYLLLDGHQGRDATDGWRAREGTSPALQISVEGIALAPLPSPPVPLKDAEGSFGGLENPTGVAVGPDGAIYVSDSEKHRLYKIVRREGLRPRAHFYRVAKGPYAADRFVYVPVESRVERWPRSLPREPQDREGVEVICETAWDEKTALKAILYFAGGAPARGGGCGCGGGVRSGCGCRGRGRSGGGGCSCGGGKISRASCDCGCETLEVIEGQTVEELTSDRECGDPYPNALATGRLCKTSIEYLPCLGGLGSAPRRFNRPRGLAISRAGDLYVADSLNHRVQVFGLEGLNLKKVWGRRANAADVANAPQQLDECAPAKGSLRLGQPVAGGAPGEFREPWDVAADAEDNVYVADKGNGRVQKFVRRTRRFEVFDGTVLGARFFQVLYGAAARDRFVFVHARRRLERWPHALGHDPQNPGETTLVSPDVRTVDEARLLLLESLGAKGATDMLVEWDGAYPAALAAVPQPEPPFSSPTHLVFDRAGRLYVVDEDKDYVKVLDREGRVLGRVQFTEDVAADFRPTTAAVEEGGNLLLAGDRGLYRLSLESAAAQAGGGQQGGACRREGGTRGCGKQGGACSSCRTHEAAGPSGEVIVVAGKTIGVSRVAAPSGFVKEGLYVSRQLDSGIENCSWHKLLLEFAESVPTGTSVTVSTYTSEAPEEEQPPGFPFNLGADEWQTSQINADDFLVLSPPGRFLWMKIELRGNGVETPMLRRLKVFFPRTTYLEYLPAVYQADPSSKSFLERFLSIFETTFSGIENTVGSIAQLFDADSVPAEGAPGDFLTWLAGWVALVFDPAWPTETRRRLLRNVPELYRKRGTPEGLKLVLRLALGVEVRILEHFRLRQWLFLAADSTLCNSSRVWGNCIVSRLQLDENSRIGDFALTGTGDPLRDPFFVHAHRFTVFVPASLLRTEAAERMMRSLIEREKPAHTLYDLVKVEPRFRVGVQSTVGIDTQVGAYPRAALNLCATLGSDTLLGCEPGGRGMRVGARSRVGVGTVVG